MARFFLALVSVVSLSLASAAVGAGADDWPRKITTDGATITVYQPQPESFSGNVITARAAISVKAARRDEPVFGAIWTTSRVETDRDTRRVRILDCTVDRVRFPDATEEQKQRLSALIEAEVPKWEFEVPLDDLVASLDAEEKALASGDDLRNDPPRILYRSHPAILVTLDGEPILRDIENTKLRRVVNTGFPIVFDPGRKTYFLNGTLVWFAAPDVVKGPWNAIDAPPREVADLFKEPEGDEPEKPDDALSPAELRRAEIVVSTEPSELIVSEGEPRWAPIAGIVDVLHMTNSESEVLLDVNGQEQYVVLSGRWYKAKSMDGPWSFVEPGALPASFRNIPPGSPAGDVLAQVPGTDASKDAVLDAMIPQTAAIRRSEAKLEVQYDGEPEFEKVTGTDIQYAVNTGSQVLRVKGRYYACEQGVWYVSANPSGPWAVSDERPDGVDDIPATSPVYNTRYVYVYDSTPEVVYIGYLPGYTNCYVYHGTVVYGTGWYYRPWVSRYYYYPRPCTFGFHAIYDPWTGWSYGMSWIAGWITLSYGWGGYYGGGYYGGGYRAGYHHGYQAGFWAGQHAGSCGYFGPGGYHPRPTHHERVKYKAGRPSTQRATRPANIYHRPQNVGMTKPSTRPSTQPATRPGTRPSDRPTTRPARPAPAGGKNNVYADRDGNVYRSTDKGWESRDKGAWKPSSPGAGSGAVQARPATRQTRPAGPTLSGKQNLNQDRTARQQTTSRSRTPSHQARPQSRPTKHR